MRRLWLFNYLLSTQWISRIWPRNRTSESGHFEPKIALCSPHWRLHLSALQLDPGIGMNISGPGPWRFQSSRFWSNLFFQREQVWLSDPQVSSTWVERQKRLIKTSSIHTWCLSVQFEVSNKRPECHTAAVREPFFAKEIRQVSKLDIADRPCLPALPAHLVPWYFQDFTCAFVPLTKPSEVSAAPMHAPMASRMGKGDLEW